MAVYEDSQFGLCIDISGPDGNAFVLMGYAKNYLRQLDYDKDEVSKIMDEMTNGNYENLLDVFEKYLGDYITLVGR